MLPSDTKELVFLWFRASPISRSIRPGASQPTCEQPRQTRRGGLGVSAAAMLAGKTRRGREVRHRESGPPSQTAQTDRQAARQRGESRSGSDGCRYYILRAERRRKETENSVQLSNRLSVYSRLVMPRLVLLRRSRRSPSPFLSTVSLDGTTVLFSLYSIARLAFLHASLLVPSRYQLRR